MGMLKGLLKGAVIAKIVQVAGRELSKPENQRKIKEGLHKVSQKARTHR